MLKRLRPPCLLPPQTLARGIAALPRSPRGGVVRGIWCLQALAAICEQERLARDGSSSPSVV